MYPSRFVELVDRYGLKWKKSGSSSIRVIVEGYSTYEHSLYDIANISEDGADTLLSGYRTLQDCAKDYNKLPPSSDSDKG